MAAPGLLVESLSAVPDWGLPHFSPLASQPGMDCLMGVPLTCHVPVPNHPCVSGKRDSPRLILTLFLFPSFLSFSTSPHFGPSSRSRFSVGDTLSNLSVPSPSSCPIHACRDTLTH